MASSMRQMHEWPTDFDGGRDAPPTRARHRAAWLSGLVVAVMVSVRLLVVSGYQVSSAVALAESTNPAATVVGTILPLLPIVLPHLAVLAFFWAVVQALRHATGSSPGPFLCGCALVLGALLVSPARSQDPDTVAFNAFVVAGLLVLLSWGAVSLFGYRPDGERLAGCWLGLAGLLFVWFVWFDVVGRTLGESVAMPWLPPEVVHTSSGARLVGYVVGTSSGWTTVLREDTREVVLIRRFDVASREICSLGPPQTSYPPLSAAPSVPTSVPACEDVP